MATRLILVFYYNIQTLNPIGSGCGKLQNGTVSQKTSVTKWGNQHLKEMIAGRTCIVRVEWKDATCKDVRSCKWNRQAIGIKPSSCRGGFQSLPENNCIQYRKCKLSGGEEISPVGGLLLHPNERKCVCNHAHFRYWINILIQLFRCQIIRKLTVLGSLVTKHVAVDFVPNLCCCSNHATVIGQSISVISIHNEGTAERRRWWSIVSMYNINMESIVVRLFRRTRRSTN